ncbi:hypothetical protein K435DRAFT_961582 [Dendrothele bispora CBS 962.96]|uniref:DH domain-containing protein n=1 Tax=Dendrothele bispora (strain CBS 962.96) TaxID=1314807 RepID=A0A4S8MPC0_DENBC|nr:hypothetical protein K435DRAFT_961582 [Dendrothele bispora CBS 962.96]
MALVDSFNKLPPLPPLEDDAPRDSTPPPPPKFSTSSPLASPSLPAASPPVPSSPRSIPSDSSKPKKTNPLNDLIDTERSYVDQLTGIIRKVAAAWSRSNLPPAELDAMFRSIETVYKANRSLLGKLKEIGTNPSSPKALGDLLMRWIDDLEAPYTAYCAKYCCGFDEWEPVQSNSKLSPVLATFSVATPPPSSDPPIWTLDALFLLPKGRLKYYKKLYTRLLKSTAPGRSDHRLLLGAVSKLDRLLETLEQREKVKVGSSVASPQSQSSPELESEDQVVMDIRTNSVGSDRQVTQESDPVPGSAGSSVRESSNSGEDRLSRETASTSINRGSSTTMTMPITELERRLSTQRTLDIFTMNPKAVRLQMVPPSLPFTREMRCSIDIVIRVTPRATGTEIVHSRGHIFILSDLFLVCERMTLEERTQQGDSNGADMWLCYPPLAGKVLRVNEVPGQDNALEVHIMRKETLTLEAESVRMRDSIIKDFKECIEFAGSVGPISKQPPPPLPPLPASVRSMGASSVPVSPMDRQTSQSPRASVEPMLDQFSRMGMSPENLAGGLPSPPAKDYSQPPLSSFSGSIGPGQAIGPGQSFGPGQTMNAGQSFGPGQAMSARQPVAPGQVFGPSRSVSMASHRSYDSMRSGPSTNSPHSTMQSPMPMGPQGGPQGDPMRRGPQPFNGGPNFPPQQPYTRPVGPGMSSVPNRPPSAPNAYQNELRKAPSTRSLSSASMQDEYRKPPSSAPPLPQHPGGFPPSQYHPNFNHGPGYGGPPLHAPQPRALLPSAQLDLGRSSTYQSFADPSPPGSPVEETPSIPSGPVTSTVSASMKCKVFLKQQHAQWKSLGSAKLKVYKQDPTNIKQLVVEADNKDKSVLISTIVLTDGVERVGKTGVAVEISDQGRRTGIVYMIQLRNETSAGGLFDTLLEGSDRSR